MFVKLFKIGEVHFRLFYSNSFHVKAKNERFTAPGWHCTKISSRHLAETTSTSCTKKHAARAARLFFLIQPIKSLICGDVEAVPVVVS